MNTKMTYEVVENAETFERMLARVREAQKVFATYTQEQVDKIFRAAAMAANLQRIPLAKMAVEETGMGVVKTRSSRTTTRLSTSITPTRTPRPAALSRRTPPTAPRRSPSPSVLSAPLSPPPTPLLPPSLRPLSP